MAYFYGLGRRKSSTARVRLVKGKGIITVNDMPANEYFSDSQLLLHELDKPFIALQRKINMISALRLTAWSHGQVDAIRLGIAKALVELNPDFKNTLRRAELLGRDPREKERKKFGLKGARKKRQFTKR